MKGDVGLVLVSVLLVAVSGCLWSGPESYSVEWEGEVVYCQGTPAGCDQGEHMAVHLPDVDGRPLDVDATLHRFSSGSSEDPLVLEVGAGRGCDPDCEDFRKIASDRGTGELDVAVEDLGLSEQEVLVLRVIAPPRDLPTQDSAEFGVTGLGFYEPAG